MLGELWVERAGDLVGDRNLLLLDQAFGATKLRRAIVVPNSRLAYLARLAFGEEEYRVFYNDIVAAVAWLTDRPANG